MQPYLLGEAVSGSASASTSEAPRQIQRKHNSSPSNLGLCRSFDDSAVCKLHCVLFARLSLVTLPNSLALHSPLDMLS
jgi:hypothetical protein